MSASQNRKVVRWCAVVIASLVLLYIAMVSGICRKTVYIDVNSGLLSKRTRLLFVSLHSEALETDVSTYAKKLGVQPDWRVVSSKPVFPAWLPHQKVFVDYVYGDVPIQIAALHTVWEVRSFSEDERRQSAISLLTKWREDTTDRSGSRYVFELNEAGFKQ